jgi:hypothetical protein
MQWRNTIVAGEFNSQSLPELSKLFLFVIFKKYIDKALPSHSENVTQLLGTILQLSYQICQSSRNAASRIFRQYQEKTAFP